MMAKIVNTETSCSKLSIQNNVDIALGDILIVFKYDRSWAIFKTERQPDPAKPSQPLLSVIQFVRGTFSSKYKL